MANINYKEFSVPRDLLDKVLTRLAIEQRLRQEKHQLVMLSGAALVLSFVAFFTWQSFYNQAQSSGFIQYLSLLYYDFGSLTIYWRDLSLSLLESLPVIAAIKLSVLFVAVFYCFKSMIKYSHDLFINYYLTISK